MPHVKKIYKEGDAIGCCTYITEDPSNLTTKMLRNRKATFKCRCGNLFTTGITNVSSLHTQSCGCVNLANVRNQGKHLGSARGNKRKSGYGIWAGIKSRCLNTLCPEYHYYGGRGVTVCERWANSYEAFIEDMGVRPSMAHSIDRIVNDKGYYKENCRWATKKQQMNNMSTNVMVNYRGQTKTMAEWCDELGMVAGNARANYKNYGSMEYVVTKHILRHHGNRIKINVKYNGN